MLSVGDASAVLLSLVISLASGGSSAGDQILWGLVAVPILVALFKIYGLYDRDVKRISHSTVDDLPRLFHASLTGGLILWLYARLTPMHDLGLEEIALFVAGVVVLAMVSRSILRGAAGTLIGRERALLVGSGVAASQFARKLAAHPEYRLDVIGALVSAEPASDDGDGELPVIGTLSQLDDIAAAKQVNRVVLSAQDIEEPALELLLERCRSLALKVSVLPRLSEVLGSGVEVDDVEGITVLGVNPPWLTRSSLAVKRAMDVTIASVLLIVLSPLLLALAVAVRLGSRGPALFAQERVGRDGRHFRLLKFRTMVADAEQRRAELVPQSTDPGWLKLEHDPRITRVGRWMRRFSLDELPQLWNVLRGEMSMVGPRPLIPEEDELITGSARGRLDLTPGMTGYWQVLGRTRIPFEEMVKLDYLYVMNWSVWEDARLLLKTLPVVVRGRGAN
jgi:exopolysaccharide biosynthesis polyprenyl glycosylphosphotransferase